MGKHHTEDYKLSAVKYALRTDNQVETCEVFDCKRASLQRWIETYRETGSPIRTTRRQRTAYKDPFELNGVGIQDRNPNNPPAWFKRDAPVKNDYDMDIDEGGRRMRRRKTLRRGLVRRMKRRV